MHTIEEFSETIQSRALNDAREHLKEIFKPKYIEPTFVVRRAVETVAHLGFNPQHENARPFVHTYVKDFFHSLLYDAHNEFGAWEADIKFAEEELSEEQHLETELERLKTTSTE